MSRQQEQQQEAEGGPKKPKVEKTQQQEAEGGKDCAYLDSGVHRDVSLEVVGLEVVGRFLRSSQHAYRNHRERVAAIVVTLFNDQTPADDVEMLYIKETVFGVKDGAPLMDRSHPCLAALAAAYTGACNCV